MRSSSRLTLSIAAAAAVGLAAVTAVSADPAPKAGSKFGTAAGLSADGKTMSSFPLSNPGAAKVVGQVSGLSGDTKLIGIDVRIANRMLYGVGEAGGVYTINRTNAKATKVGQLTAALSGTNFDIDFNPAADRLRIISDTGQSLRHDVNPGGATLVDGTLAYTPGTPATGITAVAYTNNDVSAETGTTLFDIDTTLNRVAQQVPANDGTLVVSGPLGVDPPAEAGFDIWTGRAGNGLARENMGFAVFTAGPRNMLQSIDLLSGKATWVGNFKGVDVADLAIIFP